MSPKVSPALDNHVSTIPVYRHPIRFELRNDKADAGGLYDFKCASFRRVSNFFGILPDPFQLALHVCNASRIHGSAQKVQDFVLVDETFLDLLKWGFGCIPWPVAWIPEFLGDAAVSRHHCNLVLDRKAVVYQIGVGRTVGSTFMAENWKWTRNENLSRKVHYSRRRIKEIFQDPSLWMETLQWEKKIVHLGQDHALGQSIATVRIIAIRVRLLLGSCSGTRWKEQFANTPAAWDVRSAPRILVNVSETRSQSQWMAVAKLGHLDVEKVLLPPTIALVAQETTDGPTRVHEGLQVFESKESRIKGEIQYRY